MHRDQAILLRHLLTLRRVSGGCLVLLYLFTATPLAPALTSLLAVTDRSHRVVVGQTAEGVQVVLHHDCFNSPTHRHGTVAQVLALVAQPPAGGHDHVIQFAVSALAEQASGLAIAPVPGAPTLHPFLPPDLQPHLADPCPSLRARGSLLNVRSTVLLI